MNIIIGTSTHTHNLTAHIGVIAMGGLSPSITSAEGRSALIMLNFFMDSALLHYTVTIKQYGDIVILNTSLCSLVPRPHPAG